MADGVVLSNASHRAAREARARTLGPVNANPYCASSLSGVQLPNETARLQPTKVSPDNLHFRLERAIRVFNRE
jgi:hypothetical protein